MNEEFKNAWHNVRGISSEEMKQAVRDCRRLYGDILYRQRPVSPAHPPLSMEQKAAQYSPFAALTGFEDAIDETGRITENKISLDEDEKEQMDRKLQAIRERIREQPHAAITFFVPDERKEGGRYETISGNVKALDPVLNRIVLVTGETIPVADILEIMV